MTHKLCVLVHAVVGLLLLATTIEDKHIATMLPTQVLVKCWQRIKSPVPDITRVKPLPLVICALLSALTAPSGSQTLNHIPCRQRCPCRTMLLQSGSSKNYPGNPSSAPAVPGASRRVLFFMCSLKVNLVLKVM